MHQTHRRSGIGFNGRLRLLQLSALALPAILAMPQARAGFTSATSYDVYQQDQLSGNLDFEEDTDTASASGSTLANVAGSLKTTYQTHDYATTMGGAFNTFGDSDVNLYGTRSHTFDMTGEKPTAKKWNRSNIHYTGQSTFTDQLNIAPATGGIQPKFVTVDFVWKLTGLYSHQLDVDTNEQPLYHISDHIKFKARDTGGNLHQPAELDVTTRDTDASGMGFWSTLDAPVDFRNSPVPQVHDEQLNLSVTLGDAPGGGFNPLSLEVTLDIESDHHFLNDGPQLNYGLTGFIEYHFANSADLLGLIVRDSAGAIRTDVLVTSQAGVAYTILPEPGSATLLCLAAASMLRRRKTTR